MKPLKLALIGHPVKYSYSPWIHKRFLKQAGLTGDYELKEIEPHQLNSDTMAHLKHKQWDGFNVTVPHKQTIIPFLDGLDKRAEHTGAVNTVVQTDGRWIGYNTDGIGFTKSLDEAYPNALDTSSRILLIGAGGAARAIYDALLFQGYLQIDIANRTVASAEALSRDLKTPKAKTHCLTLDTASKYLRQYDLIIQTTSVGMKPNHKDKILSPHNIKPEAIVSDIVYQPLETTFLSESKKNGANVHYGHLMLLHQAREAFELWTNQNVHIGAMAKEMRLQLEGE